MVLFSNRLIAAIALAAVASGALLAQAPDSASFEVASVKPSAPAGSSNPLASMPRIMPLMGGRFSATNVPLRMLVRVAYAVQDFQIVGGPPWQMSSRFDIQAKAESGVTGEPKDLQRLLKALLAERFALKTHLETREMPISTLVVARGDGRLGPDLKPSTADCPDPQVTTQRQAEMMARGGAAALMTELQNNPACTVMPMMPAGGKGGMGLRASGQPMQILIALLTQTTGRVVQDRTGLTGLYDWQLTFDPQVMMQAVAQLGVAVPAGAALPQSDAPALLTALQEQLGLKLETQRGPVDVLVIDSAELPTPD